MVAEISNMEMKLHISRLHHFHQTLIYASTFTFLEMKKFLNIGDYFLALLWLKEQDINTIIMHWSFCFIHPFPITFIKAFNLTYPQGYEDCVQHTKVKVIHQTQQGNKDEENDPNMRIL